MLWPSFQQDHSGCWAVSVLRGQRGRQEVRPRDKCERDGSGPKEAQQRGHCGGGGFRDVLKSMRAVNNTGCRA